MLSVGFHARQYDLKIETGNVDAPNAFWISLRLDGGGEAVLFLNTDQATQLAKALLSQVQQIEEKEVANHE